MSIGIIADRIRPAGYFARNFSKRASSSGENVIALSGGGYQPPAGCHPALQLSSAFLAVRVSEYEIHASEAGDHVGDQRPFNHFRNRLQVTEARSAPVHAIRLLRSIADHVDANLAARRFDRLVNL